MIPSSNLKAMIQAMLDSDKVLQEQLKALQAQINVTGAHPPPLPIEYNDVMKKFVDKEDKKE
jgi:hypothetical protein